MNFGFDDPTECGAIDYCGYCAQCVEIFRYIGGGGDTEPEDN